MNSSLSDHLGFLTDFQSLNKEGVYPEKIFEEIGGLKGMADVPGVPFPPVHILQGSIASGQPCGPLT